MSVFEKIRAGKSYDIYDADYQSEVHGEINRARHLCYLINQIDPDNRERIVNLEKQLLNDHMTEDTFLTPPF